MNNQQQKLFSVILLIFTLMTFGQLQGQSILTLDQIIDYASSSSLEAEKALNQKETSYWYYQRIRSNIKPRLGLSSDPNYQKSINSVTQPDGSVQFRSVENLNNDLTLELDQNILWTGGSVSVFSTLRRNDVYTGNNTGRSYAANPLAIGFTQPLFSYNQWKWQKKIEPIRYEESIKRFKEDRTRISHTSTRLFFDLLLAQINLQIAEKNK